MLVADVVTRTEQIRIRPDATADATAWATRLAQVSKLWGDGWVLRQAVALLPATVDIRAIAARETRGDMTLTRALQREADARANRGDAKWWRKDWDAAATDLERRSWLFSILTTAHMPVVLDLATEIDTIAAALTPKHYRALEMALRSFAQSSLKRVLSLREPLRLGQVNYSARTLWLLRPIVTDGSVEQIDKKLAAVFEDLLLPGMGDRRQLVRIVGADKTIKIESLKGTRDLLPAGAWAGDIKLGLMRTPLARKILEHPDQWPTEIVGRAIQQVAGQMNHMPPIAQLAEDNKWFQIA